MAGQDVTVTISGDRQLGIRFDQFPQQAHDRLKERITQDVAELGAAIRADAPRRTGALAADVSTNVIDKTERITGLVFFKKDFAKVSALEYGVHRPVQVAAHMARLDHVFRERLAAPLSVLIEAHSRAVDLTAREFIRGPARGMAGEITQGLKDAVGEAIDQGAAE